MHLSSGGCTLGCIVEPPITPGDQIGPYTILSQIGAGGMGQVWKANDTRLDRIVALKVSSTRFARRFEREARFIASLNHPNICTLYDVGPNYLVMEFIEGKPVRGPLPVPEVLPLGLQIAEALDAAHRKGIVHRDLKPGNILVTPRKLIKVLDFGIAMTDAGSELPPDAPTALTAPGAVLGTVAYMSPEQARGETLDARTDLWSFGVILYELATGARPFGGNTAGVIFEALLTREARHPQERNPALPSSLAAIIVKALQKDRELRYQSAADMCADLRRAAGQSTPSEATATLSPDPDPFARHRQRPAWALPSFLAVALIVAGIEGTPLRTRIAELFRPAGTAPRHIVVLPFRNIGNDPANAAVCDGLTEVITSRLTGLEQTAPTLWVIPASEVRRKNVSSEQEAKTQFGAALAISGSVQRNTAGVQLALNLVDAESLRVVASRLVRSTAGDLSALEEGALKNIGDMLAIEVQPLKSAAASSVPAAYEAYIRAQGLLQRSDKPENVDEALRTLNRAVEQDPRFALGYSGLAKAYWAKWTGTKDTRWLDASSTNAEKALSLDPQIPLAHISLAQAWEASRNPELATHELQEALRLDPRNSEALLELGRILETTGRTAEADQKFQQAIALHPDYWGGYNDYALFLAREGRLPDAERQYRRGLQLAPDNARIYSNLGSLLVRSGRLDEAAALFEKSNAVSPSYFAFANLGTVYIRQNKPRESARAYEQALKLNDKDYRVWAYLAGAYERFSDPRAKPVFERASTMALAALRREPQSPVLLAELAFYAAKLGHRTDALDYARQATLLAPADPKILSRATLGFELAGDRDDALKSIAAALQHGETPDVVTTDPELQQLASDPRFAAILASAQKSGGKNPK